MTFTKAELIILRHAMRIAAEDGSLYGDDPDDKKRASLHKRKEKQFDAIEEKLDAAIRGSR